MASTISQYDFTAPFEGVVNHLYLDTKGLVTCGVGFLLPRIDDALACPFAPHSAVQKDWDAVRAVGAGHGVRAYARVTRGRLPDAWMRLEFDRRMALFAYELAKIWPAWDTFPEPARRALLDMAWNLGAGALRRHWPSLKLAVARRDWAAAAAHSARKGVQERRNTATAALFTSAIG